MLHYTKIFLGGACNNNCLHCPSDHKNSPQIDLETINSSLEQKQSDSVIFYGGEPTLRNDLLHFVRFAREKGVTRIKLVTNGRAFSNVHYLQQLLNAGCLLFEITLWGSNPNLHDYLSRVSGSFWESINGIENLAASPNDKFVCIRIPICKENLPDLQNTVITALNVGAHRIILSMQDQTLSVQAALPHILNSINISIFNRVWILTEGIPFCLMRGLEPHISEIYSGWETLFPRTYQKNRRCAECTYENLCPGTDVNYVKKLGYSEFQPVTAGRHSQEIRALYD